MTLALPKWIMQRYSLLWKAFKTKEFKYEEASKALKEREERLVSVVLSELKKHGWLTLKIHPEDSRKRIYQLKAPEEAVNELEQNEKKEEE